MLPELLLVLTGGLLGSAHCVGMCGGFALSIGASSKNWRPNLARQLVYSAGRIATYTAAGAIAGYGGLALSRSLSTFVPVQALLSLAAGILLVVQGLFAAGVILRAASTGQHPCLGPKFLSAFLLAPGWTNAFFAGVFTGFLPCGLVYAFLTLAAATENMFVGWLTMFAFGLGTVPIMVLTGLGGGLMSLAGRRRMFQVAGWCVVLAGALSIARGLGATNAVAAFDAESETQSTVDCLWCRP